MNIRAEFSITDPAVPSQPSQQSADHIASSQRRARRPEVHAAGYHAAPRAALRRGRCFGHPTQPFEHGLPDTALNDLGQNVIRPDLAVVHGADVPEPFGGKQRIIMASLDRHALDARGLSPSDVSRALQQQNVILPSGDVKIGRKDYLLTMNNSPDVVERINAFPIKRSALPRFPMASDVRACPTM
jgi:AcrB/AcrD/AcrF family